MPANPLETDENRQRQIRERAYHLWEADGCPEGRDLEYWERARELLALEESAGAGMLPNPMAHPNTLAGRPEGVEEAEIQENLGEFPDRMADQGEWQPTPEPRHSKRGRRKAEAAAPRRGPPKPAGSS